MPRRNIAVERTAADIADAVDAIGRGQTPVKTLGRLQERWREQRPVVRAAGARVRRLRPELSDAVLKLIADLELNEAQERAPMAQVPVTPARVKTTRVDERMSKRRAVFPGTVRLTSHSNVRLPRR